MHRQSFPRRLAVLLFYKPSEVRQRTILAQQEEQKAVMQREAEEVYLNTKQVRELLDVCEGTLNLWAKRGYLVPVKVGNKNMYAKSDVRRVQTGGKSESVTSYCKRKNG